MTSPWYWFGFAVVVGVVFVIGCVLLEKRDDESFRDFIRTWPGGW